MKVDGSLIGELDLFHHRPYECLLLGYIYGKASHETERVKPCFLILRQISYFILCSIFSFLFFSFVLQDTDSEHLTFKSLQDNLVIISIPGDHSRKPPIESILALSKHQYPGLRWRE